jgi:predicted LPLAT superfamily acyltransferase
LIVAPWFLLYVALYFVLFAPAARRASGELARRVGRGSTAVGRWWFCFRQFFAFGQLQVDRVALLGGHRSLFAVRSVGREHLRAALAEGRGAILVTAHLGNWEVLAQTLSGTGARVTLVMHDGVAPQLRATLEALSRGRAFRVLFNDGSPAAAAAVLAALRAGDVVGLMGDRVQAGEAAAVDLLGAPAPFPVGPYALAAVSGAPLLHVFTERLGFRRYQVTAFPPQTLRFTGRRRRREDLARWAQAFATRLEPFLRRRPEQWGNLYSLWEAAATSSTLAR